VDPDEYTNLFIEIFSSILQKTCTY